MLRLRLCRHWSTELLDGSHARRRWNSRGAAGPALLVQRRLARKRPGVSGQVGLAPDAVGIAPDVGRGDGGSK
eukprot:312317-Pyramimonas_sp.AAC.1